METMTTQRSGRASESKSRSFGSSDKSGHAIRNAATALGEGAEHMASAIANKADEAAAATGRGIESVADQIRSHTPDKGLVGTASNTLADSLEHGGKYLEKKGVTGMTDDVTMLVRSYPITSLLTAVGVGFLVARATACRNG